MWRTNQIEFSRQSDWREIRWRRKMPSMKPCSLDRLPSFTLTIFSHLSHKLIPPMGSVGKYETLSIWLMPIFYFKMNVYWPKIDRAWAKGFEHNAHFDFSFLIISSCLFNNRQFDIWRESTGEGTKMKEATTSFFFFKKKKQNGYLYFLVQKVISFIDALLDVLFVLVRTT